MSSNPIRKSIVLVLALSTALGCAPSIAADAKRPLRFSDLYREESLRYHNEWTLTPDGAMAVVIMRAPSMGKLWRAKGSDVWVRPTANEPFVNLTEGEADGTEWRDPLWSPDGSRLLMMGTRGSAYSLWLWDKRTNKLSQLCERPMHFGVFGALGESYFEWLDNDHAIAVVLPPEVRPRNPALSELPPMTAAKAGWAKWMAGESSASVLETGRPTRKDAPKPQATDPGDLRQVLRIDIGDGKTTLIMDSYRPASMGFYKPSLSPDGRFVVVQVYGPPVGDGMRDAHGTLNIAIRRTDGQPLSFDAPLPGDVLPGTPVWSLDGTELAYFASGASREQPPKLVRASVATGHVEVRETGDVIATYNREGMWGWTNLEWTDAGDLVVLAGAGEEALVKYARRDWWLIPRTGPLRNLTRELAEVPVFKRLSPSGPLLGVAEGRVWKLEGVKDSAKGAAQPVTVAGPMAIKQIVWPQTDDYATTNGVVSVRRFLISREERPTNGVIIVSDGDRAAPAYAKVDTNTGQVTKLAPPAPGAWLTRLSPKADTAFWVDARVDSTQVWQVPLAQPGRATARKVIALNAWRDRLITPPTKTIEYTSLYGDASRAWMQLPANYKAGQRYPLIVHIYPGQQARAEPLSEYNRMGAAAGYVMMHPQMGPDNGRMYGMRTRDPYFEVTAGVLPAIDKAIELGIVDPDRLFVEGLSMGGFATYSMIQQTLRFRAALAMVGISSWMNGSFSSRGRYGEDLAGLNIGWMSENVQQRPSTETPWSDQGLYMRNSPIFYAERIQTPLLIVHSDQDDNVPMSHSEEMFSAMVQLKKRASFVRYWGEGHAINSPANQRDLWQRRLAWFEEFGDIARDAQGNMVFEGGRVKSRGNAAALKPEDYAKFELFQ